LTAAFVAHVLALGVPAYRETEIAFMYETVRDVQPTHIFEWGTNAGSSARIWSEAVHQLGLDAQIHSTDLHAPGSACSEYPGFVQGQWVDGLPGVTLYQGDGLETTLRLCVELRPARPLVFLDDSHQLLQNARALRMLRFEVPDAVILVDDAATGEPALALEWFLGKHGDEYEVVSAGPQTRLWPRRA
jgi:cephalosporin hydroxylase